MLSQNFIILDASKEKSSTNTNICGSTIGALGGNSEGSSGTLTTTRHVPIYPP